ncbi:hypothetical protein Nepgr_009807 [Nepenthes gracilis]|uniref:Uncharacterized protein n=1 Tax=Nepenthes gracilis TaxID=150966 RepID=A0AAD3SC24_NEPGR|nr:hypothetical protein Nepgr_009807 [Nepenthes gracilis]
MRHFRRLADVSADDGTRTCLLFFFIVSVCYKVNTICLVFACEKAVPLKLVSVLREPMPLFKNGAVSVYLLPPD